MVGRATTAATTSTRDLPEDIHSPRQRGFWWSHMGWILAKRHTATDLDAHPGLREVPELRLLNKR